MGRCCKPAFCGRGQSLIEVVVSVGMISILFVSLLSLVSLSLKNSRLARARSQAVSLAQEGIELMRAYRDYNVTAIFSLLDESYNLPANWVVADGLSALCQNQPSINNVYWRCVRFTTLGANEIETEVSVGWKEGSQDFATSQTTTLSLWER